MDGTHRDRCRIRQLHVLGGPGQGRVRKRLHLVPMSSTTWPRSIGLAQMRIQAGRPASSATCRKQRPERPARQECAGEGDGGGLHQDRDPFGQLQCSVGADRLYESCRGAGSLPRTRHHRGGSLAPSAGATSRLGARANSRPAKANWYRLSPAILAPGGRDTPTCRTTRRLDLGSQTFDWRPLRSGCHPRTRRPAPSSADLRHRASP